MHHGIVSCDAAAPLSEVAATMCAHGVHALRVVGDGRPAAIITDADLLAAVERDAEGTAGDVAATAGLTISAGRSLLDASRLMTEHGVTHLLVRHARNGHVIGIISTTDITCALGAAVSVGSRA